MKIKTTLAALALITVPALASATCAGKTHQAMSCAEGTVWDADSQACVAQINS
ncbi:Chitin binding Peritrophin-A domain-containing protein [Lutimaribacter pacificus]|uniref:Chitin binding Peritrophin-A domain-containing protein n=1 Tax=Lutimaribacter pacificus TaxID=391948 RepID=A0A1H0AQX5_9RHOB|nr:carbohydrate-binding module family 14 protein [Lutimaribacter pacificus]SDN35724.1 Chitin binding Peritrophin-A domain-containing protein [Lutimaribacter pacificus]SHJ66219.1 Chitin binding Peritrophin-A domain-containing protein [Lutimaribacter pacificus]